ncbi:hematopoietic prostaglandin D synthase-like [Physella acuta]|uniref:hematopoietic prostaglandin D synthase-like n=1 Tax=Physella acuta TaxID=109671 RepID=UPI0027DB76BA|nr:hematopoietic prostaglandin D synthase-like [Physella acuta]XP_059165958.1 hematopoietic prostaglandin D synthase-like [Physella acuta]XP_059165959.1 hematopoietic prostaglandin D synthase-like [Physella acuta]
MSRLKADIPPPRKAKAYDPSPLRHPPLTPQWRWAQKYVSDMRFLQRTHFLGLSRFRILARQRKGTAELMRLLLSYASIPFEDHILLDVDWKSLMCKMPYGNLPVLWIDHNVYGEPNAISRHLANHLSLLGNTETEMLVAEAVFDQVTNLKESDVMQKAYEEYQERPDDNFEQVMTVLLPNHFKFWDDHIAATPGPYILGSGLSVADLAIYDFVDQYRVFLPIDNVIIYHKNLLQLLNIIKAHPRLVQYFKRTRAQ